MNKVISTYFDYITVDIWKSRIFVLLNILIILRI